jgi:monothiol glutaredoxin
VIIYIKAHNDRGLSLVSGLEKDKLSIIINITLRKPRVIMETIEKIEQQLKENPILLYMKGSPKLPNCGFSSQASQALMSCGEQFAYVDILQNPDIRAELPKYADWPTFPQLWVDGELVGGCDIILEMTQQGELQPLIKETAAKYAKED